MAAESFVRHELPVKEVRGKTVWFGREYQTGYTFHVAGLDEKAFKKILIQ